MNIKESKITIKGIALNFDMFLKEGGVGASLFFVLLLLIGVNGHSLYFLLGKSWLSIVFAILGAIAFSVATTAIVRRPPVAYPGLRFVFPVFDAGLVFLGLNLELGTEMLANPLRFILTLIFSLFLGAILLFLGIINSETHEKEIDQSHENLKTENIELKSNFDKAKVTIAELKSNSEKSKVTIEKAKVTIEENKKLESNYRKAKVTIAELESNSKKSKVTIEKAKVTIEENKKLESNLREAKVTIEEMKSNSEKSKVTIENAKVTIAKNEKLESNLELNKKHLKEAVENFNDLIKQYKTIDYSNNILKEYFITVDAGRIKKMMPDNKSKAEIEIQHIAAQITKPTNDKIYKALGMP